MKSAVFFFLVFFCSQTDKLKAQDISFRECPLEETMRVQTLLDSMAAKNFEASRIPGFRILLYSGNSREDANRAKEKLYILFPKADAYLVYQAPTFKVRFGNYYNKIDAWLDLIKLLEQFPQAVITSEVVLIKP